MKSSVKIKPKIQKCKYLHVIMNNQRISRWFLPRSSHQSSQLSSLLFTVWNKWPLSNVADIETKPSTLGARTTIFNMSGNSVTAHKWRCKKERCAEEKNKEGGGDHIWYQCSNPALEWWPVSWWPEQPESSQAKLIHSKLPSKRSALSSNSAANILQTKTSKTALC